jgi:hypothetical protein
VVLAAYGHPLSQRASSLRKQSGRCSGTLGLGSASSFFSWAASWGGALALVVPVDLARFDVAVVGRVLHGGRDRADGRDASDRAVGGQSRASRPVAAGAAAIIPSLMLLGMAGAGPTFVGAAFVAVVVAGAASGRPARSSTLGSRRDALPGLALAVGTVAWLGSYSAGTLAAGVVMDAGARAAAVWMLIVPAAGAWWLAVRGRWLPR